MPDNPGPQVSCDDEQTDAPPLSGIRVLDFTRFVAGPYCTMLLADNGAEVIKVEPPGGEQSRRLMPFMTSAHGRGPSTYFLRFNRGKKSVVLSPKDEKDRQQLITLIRSADVLVENFRPGVLESWGLGWGQLQDINPRLVYASVSGFGHTPTERRDWPAFNLVAEVMAGVLSQTPSDVTPPRAVGLPFGDSVASLHALSGILLGLLRRNFSGRGSRVDIAMFDSMVSMNELSVAVKSGTGENTVLGNVMHEWFAPFGMFRSGDGWLCIAAGTEGQWRAFCSATGMLDLMDDPRLSTGLDRVREFEVVILPRLTDWLASRSARDAAFTLARAGVPSAPVLSSAELLSDEQAQTRGMLPELQVQDGTSIHLAGNPVRVEPRRVLNGAGFPEVGEHNEQLLKEADGYGA